MDNQPINNYFHRIRFFVLILLVGIGAGLGAIFFRELIAVFHNLLFYGQFSLIYDAMQHEAPSRWGWGVIFVPVVGSLFVTFLVTHFAPEVRGSGVPEVMDAIHYKDGVIRPRVAFIKSLVASVSIGSGGSVGREGPIIQIGAALGAALGQWLKVSKWERITLIACGAGGGIAATFNAPAGGVLFALEIMLTEISARTIIPVLLATAIATYTSFLYFGNVPFLSVNMSRIPEMETMGAVSYLILSLVLGMVSTLFIRCIYFTEDLFHLIPGSYYVRHALGMFMLGLIMYFMMTYFGHYYIQGVGYSTVVDVLNLTLSHPEFLLFLAFLKIITTSLTIGSGGSGGIFSPLLFIGATLGGGFAALCHELFPTMQGGLTIPFGAIAGMAGLVGATTAAPLTAIIMTAEFTHNVSLILPLMVIVAIAYAVRRVLIKHSVFTMKLIRRGHAIPDVLHRHHRNE